MVLLKTFLSALKTCRRARWGVFILICSTIDALGFVQPGSSSLSQYINPNGGAFAPQSTNGPNQQGQAPQRTNAFGMPIQNQQAGSSQNPFGGFLNQVGKAVGQAVNGQNNGPQQPQTNMFGFPTQQSQQQPQTNMFGFPTQQPQQQPQTNMFGFPTQQPQQQPQTNMFGFPIQQPQQQPQTNMFGFPIQNQQAQKGFQNHNAWSLNNNGCNCNCCRNTNNQMPYNNGNALQAQPNTAWLGSPSQGPSGTSYPLFSNSGQSLYDPWGSPPYQTSYNTGYGGISPSIHPFDREAVTEEEYRAMTQQIALSQ